MSSIDELTKKLKINIKKLKATKTTSETCSYYLIKPHITENKNYYALIFNNEKINEEWLKLKKHTNYIIKYSIELKLKESEKVLVFLGIKNNDKLNIIKTSKNLKILNEYENKISDTIIYKPLENEELCVVIKINNNLFELSNDSLITIYESI